MTGVEHGIGRPRLVSNESPLYCAQADHTFSGAADGIPLPQDGWVREECPPHRHPSAPTLSSQGWKWHSPSCYWLGEDQVTYSEARRLCADYGSQLVTVTNRYGGGTQTGLHAYPGLLWPPVKRRGSTRSSAGSRAFPKYCHKDSRLLSDSRVGWAWAGAQAGVGVG